MKQGKIFKEKTEATEKTLLRYAENARNTGYGKRMTLKLKNPDQYNGFKNEYLSGTHTSYTCKVGDAAGYRSENKFKKPDSLMGSMTATNFDTRRASANTMVKVESLLGSKTAQNSCRNTAMKASTLSDRPYLQTEGD